MGRTLSKAGINEPYDFIYWTIFNSSDKGLHISLREGTLNYIGVSDKPETFHPVDIKNVFLYCATMKKIPRWQQDFIVEKYFEEYHHLFSYARDYLRLKSEDAFMLAAFIYSGRIYFNDDHDIRLNSFR